MPARGNVKHGFGWIRDTPRLEDERHLYGDAARLKPISQLSPVVDLTDLEKPIEDQGHAGSCVGHGVTRICEMLWAKEQGLAKAQHQSRRFCYYNARKREHTEDEDSGCQIRDAVMASIKVGICREETWPYDDATSAITEKPSDEAYTEALDYQVLRALRLRNTRLIELLNCLDAGYGFAIGVALYQSFEDVGSDGIVTMPTWREQFIGGHCMAAVGYNQPRKLFRITNSWGDWGDGGRCWMPFDYLTSRSLAADFWTIRAQENV